MLSINPDAATRDDIAKLAGELMEANKQIKEIEYEKVVDVRCSIDSEGKYTKYTYCYGCGAGVRNQKYCCQCGRKLNWKTLKGDDS